MERKVWKTFNFGKPPRPSGTGNMSPGSDLGFFGADSAVDPAASAAFASAARAARFCGFFLGLVVS